ncbi:MAG: nitronate monooxygenase family protein [Patescibacteria group bacterium]
MRVPKLTIGQFEFELPVVQGAMGVKVSAYPLPPTVANEGGLGTITTIGLGDPRVSHKDYVLASQEALIAEIKRCQNLTGNFPKPMAVNVMGALSNADSLITTAVDQGIKIVVYGAGIPRDLPKLVPDPSVNLVPIISSARLAGIILKHWTKHYQRLPSAFIVEGPLAGGHLGFNQAELDHPEIFNLENILVGVLATVRPYEQEFGRRIPIIVAGGIGIEDVPRWLSLGAAAVQLGTLFVATDECPVDQRFKDRYLAAKAGDAIIVTTSVGMLGRVLPTPLLAKAEAGSIKIRCPYQCLSICKIKTAKFCIADALYNALGGEFDEGLLFAGGNVHKVDRIIPVKQLMTEIVESIRNSPLTLPAE